MPTSETADRAVDFIRRHKDGPFFLNLWMHETHTPHYPEQDLMQRFDGLDEAEQVYAAVVAAGDRDVGKILSVLDELALSENTIVIFSSDNGPEWPSLKKEQDDLATGPGLGSFYSVGTTAGLKGQKRSLFAGGVRVPFIIRWPGVVAAGRVDRKSHITAVDLLPTLTSIAGAEPPDGYESDGENVLSALKGETFERREPIYWVWPSAKNSQDRDSYYWPHLAYQDGDWRLLVNDQLSKAELYRVRDDWYEKNDVASRHPEVVKYLMAEMTALRATFPDAPANDVLSILRKFKQPDSE